MKLQTATRLALYAVIDLAAAPGTAHAAGDIAAGHGASVAHMAKVMQTLARAGIVEATRGAQGGYRFTANPRRTTMLDVIELFEPVAVTAHAEPNTVDGGANAAVSDALDRVLAEIDDIARATLGSITLETLLKTLRAAGPKAVKPNQTSPERL